MRYSSLGNFLGLLPAANDQTQPDKFPGKNLVQRTRQAGRQSAAESAQYGSWNCAASGWEQFNGENCSVFLVIQSSETVYSAQSTVPQYQVLGDLAVPQYQVLGYLAVPQYQVLGYLAVLQYQVLGYLAVLQYQVLGSAKVPNTRY